MPMLKFTQATNPQPSISALPIWVRSEAIQTVSPRRVRDPEAGASAYKIEGAFIACGPGEDDGFAVAESAEAVVGRIDWARPSSIGEG